MLFAEDIKIVKHIHLPILEISLSCSLSDNILLHNVSTMVSTWNSFTLFTSGPRLKHMIYKLYKTAPAGNQHHQIAFNTVFFFQHNWSLLQVTLPCKTFVNKCSFPCSCYHWNHSCYLWNHSCYLWNHSCYLWTHSCYLWTHSCYLWTHSCYLWTQIVLSNKETDLNMLFLYGLTYHFTARFCTSPFLSSSSFSNILTTWTQTITCVNT